MAEQFGLEGAPVLVIGGGAGIGRATVELLASVGAKVAVADIVDERAKEVADAVGGPAIVGDVTDPEAAARIVDEAHEALGGLRGVANIVGSASWSDLLSLDIDTWERDLRANLSHHLFAGKAAARHMAKSGGGSIAIVASVSGIYGAPNHGAYGAGKAAAMALVRTMADEWGPFGIRVNAVAPDCIATPRVLAGFEEAGVTDIDAIAVEDRMPLGRWGRPEEIAGPLVFLLSNLSSFMTGQTLVADGGTQAIFPHHGAKPFNPHDNPHSNA